MLFLDCETPSSTLETLASAASTTPEKLSVLLKAYPPERLSAMFNQALITDPSVDPHDSVAEAVAQAVGLDLRGSAFDGAFYFHGTRVLRPTDFLEHGIRPLGAALDTLWSDLYTVTGAQLTPEDWEQVRLRLERGDTGPAPAITPSVIR